MLHLSRANGTTVEPLPADDALVAALICFPLICLSLESIVNSTVEEQECLSVMSFEGNTDDPNPIRSGVHVFRFRYHL